MNVVKLLSRIRKEWRKKKEQARSNGSCPLEIQSKSSKGLRRKMDGRARSGHSRGVLVCR